MADKQFLKDFIQYDYPQWLASRCNYGQKPQIGILAKMQPSKTHEERDYDNSPLCSAFNLALHCGLERDVQAFKCFVLVYYGKLATSTYKAINEPDFSVKAYCINHNVHHSHIYDKAHSFAQQTYNDALVLMRLKQSIKNFAEDFV